MLHDIGMSSVQERVHSGVLADMDPPPPGPNTLADLDPPTKLSENIVLNVPVKMVDTLRSSAY